MITVKWTKQLKEDKFQLLLPTLLQTSLSCKQIIEFSVTTGLACKTRGFACSYKNTIPLWINIQVIIRLWIISRSTGGMAEHCGTTVNSCMIIHRYRPWSKAISATNCRSHEITLSNRTPQFQHLRCHNFNIYISNGNRGKCFKRGLGNRRWHVTRSMQLSCLYTIPKVQRLTSKAPACPFMRQ